jgi:signal transduction histidine kinase/ligand-binding sensor domain-containing protein/ActR/RegA family two-component response regulator
MPTTGACPTFCFVLLAILLARLPAQARLLQVPESDQQYSEARWDGTRGMPQHTATCLLQSSEGPLWIGTLGGLCRFDGERMSVLNVVSGLPSSRILNLCEDRSGNLWIGTDGHGVARYRDHKITIVDQVPITKIQAIAEAGDGAMLIATPQALLRVTGDHVVALPLPGVTRLMRQKSGAVLAVDPGGLNRIDADSMELVVAAPVTCMQQLGDRMVIGTQDGLFWLNEQRLAPLQPSPHLEQRITALLAARDGSLWVGTDAYVVRLQAELLAEGKPITSNPDEFIRIIPERDREMVSALAQDAEGGIWVGYQMHGVTRLTRSDLRLRTESVGLPEHGITGVTADGDDGMYVQTQSGLYRGRDGRFEKVAGLEHLRPGGSVYRHEDGALWFGSSEGLVRYQAGQAQVVIPAAQLTCGLVRGLAAAANGDLWLAGTDGVARWSSDGLHTPGNLSKLQGSTLGRIVVAPDHAVWVGGPSLLARFSPDGRDLRLWRCGHELPRGGIRTILPEVGENAWVASYGGGIVRVSASACIAVDERHGLLDQSLCAMLQDGDRFLCAANLGSFLIWRKDLDAVVSGAALTFACQRLTAPGLHVDECNGGLQNCAAFIGGRYWISGIEGLLEIDPTSIEELDRNLPVSLAGVYLGEEPATVGSRLEASYGVRSATFRLGVCAFSGHGQVRIRWRLLGYKGEWTQPSLSREVHFDGLPPGELTFEAEAIDVRGRHSDKPLRLVLHVPQTLTETTLFQIAAPLLLLLVLTLLIKWFTLHLRRRAQSLQLLVDDRTRELVVARDDLEARVASRTQELEQALQRERAEQTSRQQLERDLHSLQRMESIGLLAGGIAHDFNNLLTVTSGAGEMLIDEADAEVRSELCRSIVDASARGRSLTQHLLAVASRQVVAVEQLNLVTLIRDLLPVLRSLVGEGIQLDFDSDHPCAIVCGAVTQIEQILINLAANARDAMSRGGTLTIQLGQAGKSVLLSVRDTGAGMPREVMEQAFTPFFSTRTGEGLSRGLGLATVYGIVKQLDGEIQIDSEPGHGTCVQISLPISMAETPAVVIPSPAVVVNCMSAHVLLIEDQDDVRRVLVSILKHLGCSTTTAANGNDAVQILRDQATAAGDRIDVILSDVVMPGLQGIDLVEALRAVVPGIPILFLSGYVEGRKMHEELARLDLVVLPKPVDMRRLAAELSRLLTSANSSEEIAGSPPT